MASVNTIEYSRLVWKRSAQAGVIPTINTGTTIDNTWLKTDILVGEAFVNIADNRAWIRTISGLQEFQLTSGSTTDLWLSGTGTGSVYQNNGTGNIASGNYSISEGASTTASGNYSHADGVVTTAAGVYSQAGGFGAVATAPGEWARTSSTVLGIQYGIVDYYKTTTNAAMTEIFIGNIPNSRFLIIIGDSVRFICTLVAKNSSTGEVKEWKAEGLIKNVGGTTTMVGLTNVS